MKWHVNMFFFLQISQSLFILDAFEALSKLKSSLITSKHPSFGNLTYYELVERKSLTEWEFTRRIFFYLTTFASCEYAVYFLGTLHELCLCQTNFYKCKITMPYESEKSKMDHSLCILSTYIRDVSIFIYTEVRVSFTSVQILAEVTSVLIIWTYTLS